MSWGATPLVRQKIKVRWRGFDQARLCAGVAAGVYPSCGVSCVGAGSTLWVNTYPFYVLLMQCTGLRY